MSYRSKLLLVLNKYVIPDISQIIYEYSRYKYYDLRMITELIKN